MISGAKAERIAADYLRKKHYKLIECNYRTRFGEIDLILEKRVSFREKQIIFVEVKMRNTSSIAEPKEFVDSSKQQKIILSATEYLSRNKINLQPRFDVIEIICDEEKIISVKHLENAFTIS